VQSLSGDRATPRHLGVRPAGVIVLTIFMMISAALGVGLSLRSTLHWL
jgi:hypothetical protein